MAAIACTITYFLPDKYRSEAAILVVPPRVSENYVRSTVTTKVEDRLRSINQQVRSRTKLERIIEDLSLYTERRKTDIMQDIVDDMSKAIDIDIVQGDVFRLAFTADNPRTAMQVTERLTTFFIDESLKDRTQLAEQAGDFLETQVADAGRRLRETEQKIAEYKKKHDGELPTQEDVNQQGLNNAQMQGQNVVLALERARDQQQLLQRRMQDLAAQAEAAAAAPDLGAGGSSEQGGAARRGARRAAGPAGEVQARSPARSIVQRRALPSSSARPPRRQPAARRWARRSFSTRWLPAVSRTSMTRASNSKTSTARSPDTTPSCEG